MRRAWWRLRLRVLRWLADRLDASADRVAERLYPPTPGAGRLAGFLFMEQAKALEKWLPADPDCNSFRFGVVRDARGDS